MRIGTALLLTVGIGVAGVAAACSGGGGGGSGTSGTPTPTGNLVKVLDSNGAPLSAVLVVVNDSAGEIVTSTQTGASGTVAVTVPATGSVTVFDVSVDAHESQTVVSPPTGITLSFVVAVAATPVPTPPETTITATFTAPANVATIVWFANCNVSSNVPYSSGVMSQQDASACSPSQAGWNILAIGRDAGSAPVAWAELGAPNSFGVALPLTVDLTNTSFDTVSVGHAALPSAGDSNASMNWVADSAGLLSVTAIPYSPALPHSAAPQSTSAPIPHGAEFSSSPGVDVLMTSTNGTSVALHQDWKVAQGTLASDYTLDPSGHALVAMGFLTQTDPARINVHWTVSAGTRGAAGTAKIIWTTGADAGVRRVVFPAGADTSFTVPKVPASAAAWLPTAASTYVSWSAGYVDVDGLADYTAFLTTDPATLPSFTRFVTTGSVP